MLDFLVLAIEIRNGANFTNVILKDNNSKRANLAIVVRVINECFLNC